jgi:glutamine amidotransferase-like uncharacterized protein
MANTTVVARGRPRRVWIVLACGVLALAAVATARLTAAEAVDDREGRISVYAGKGTDSASVVRFLRGHGFEVKSIDEPQLGAISTADCAVLCLPGGWYSFDEPTNRAIRDYVAAGGGCVATCAGAGLVAGPIGLIPGRVFQMNVRGRLLMEPRQGRHPLLRDVVQPCRRHTEREFEPIAVTLIGGPIIVPDDQMSIVATFDRSGELAAICAAAVGRGRVVALSPHPELPLADLPVADPSRNDGGDRLHQGDQSLILRNAVHWAMGRD